MTIFLFHVLNLGPKALGLANGVSTSAALLVAVLLVLAGSRLSRRHRTNAAGLNVYRHLWNGLEQVYRELQARGRGCDSNTHIELRATYDYVLRNNQSIERDDWILIRRYVLVLQCLRVARRAMERVEARDDWNGTQDVLAPSAHTQRLVRDADLLRAALRARVRHFQVEASVGKEVHASAGRD